MAPVNASKGYPELRISFHVRDELDDRCYGVELNGTFPDDASDHFYGPFWVEFDWDDADSLAVTMVSPEETDRYGRWLTGAFFKDPELRERFAWARGEADRTDSPLRVRLWLTPATPRLHGVLWERLQEPDTGRPLALNPRLHLSRYLSGGRSHALKMQPRDRLRALVAIANPAGLDNQSVAGRDLAPIVVESEWQRAETSLQSITIERLAAPEHTTLENLMTRLREGFDILYLVCHGALLDGEPWLWLENDQGGIDRVAGTRLAARLAQIQELPRLVVLASCQSGLGEGSLIGDGGELTALAPRLAEAGVPAVIAMQGDVRMQTASKFFPTFFEELLKDGQIDHAVTVARTAIAECSDWWVPTLITRLKVGRIWSEHGGEAKFSRVGEVAEKVGTNSCTPILGPDLVTTWTGSPMALAQRWALRFEYPMAPPEREGLPQVAQYLAYHRDPKTMADQLLGYLREYMVEHFPDDLPPDAKVRSKTLVHDLLNHVWGRHLDKLREQAAGSDSLAKDPHWLLAQMPFAVYILTTRDDLLEEALRKAGKDPQLEVCRWRVFEEDFAAWPQSVFTREPFYRPTPERPLVFHAFGHIRWPDTLVLTEDNFFDYLIGITRNEQWIRTSEKGETGKAAIPEVVRTALSWRSLLFLGFRVSDWEFRTLFRRILAQEQSVWTAKSADFRRKYKHVAVQLEPSAGGEFLEPEGAREYLREYFDPSNVSIQWGTASAYIEALYDAWKAAGSRVPSPEDLDRIR